MKKIALALIGLALSIAVMGQSNRNFKAFYQDANDLFDQRQFQEAIKNYKEALRLEPKALRYKVEGTFFANYLPRYRLALCYESLDIIEAERWANDSKTASESSIIKRRDKANAQYHADIERIGKAAKSFLAKRDADYNLGLTSAQSLLAQKKFEEARKAFQDLYTSDPNRNEAQLGLSQVDAQRQNYLQRLELEFQTALVASNFSEAEGKLAQAAQVDSGYTNLASMRVKLDDAREKASRVAARETIETTKEPDPVLTAEKKPEISRESPTTTPPRNDPKPQTDTREKDRQALRHALLATLKPYRRGDPEAALAQIEQIESPLLKTSGSYHWLRGLYSLTCHHYATQPEQSQLDLAAEAMATVASLEVAFEPDPDIYPEFVLEFYANQRKKGAP